MKLLAGERLKAKGKDQHGVGDEGDKPKKESMPGDSTFEDKIEYNQ